MKNYNNTQTITVLEENIIKKSRNTLHLVLRQRGFADDIIDSIKDGITEGAVKLVKFDDDLRLSVIKIGSACFCRMLPPSQVIEVETE